MPLVQHKTDLLRAVRDLSHALHERGIGADVELKFPSREARCVIGREMDYASVVQGPYSGQPISVCGIRIT